ncbi:3'-5' exonuclease [Serratia sp. TSA_198.1]|uniref:3'-5' exonuclease n=1 Tax=Serratia sp. TSA_198.1 TaxID=3415664 RepID=UPI004045BCFC
MKDNELFISVDVESSGPIPGEYSLLSIGACLLSDPEISFYTEFKPDSQKHDPEAVAVTGLDLTSLALKGLPPLEAMVQFNAWIDSVSRPGKKVVFVGLNTPFDWSFINYYFHKYTGGNPFGFTAIDIKAYYMGLKGCSWEETKSSRMVETLCPRLRASHNALEDAKFQAELFSLMLAE